MAKKNILIGFGETLTQNVTINSGGGTKNHPYTLAQAKERIGSQLRKVVDDIAQIPSDVCPNDEIVTKITLHPSYFAKSYYPNTLLRSLNLNPIGSKAITITPEQWATKDHPDEAVTTCLYISGSKESFSNFLSSIDEAEMPKGYWEDLKKIEEIDYFYGNEKVKHLDSKAQLYLEVVLHTPYAGDEILEQFLSFLNTIGGECIAEKRRVVQGLTFLPVTLSKAKISKLSEFTFCRVIRSMPDLRLIKPTMTRAVENMNLPIFPDHVPTEKPVAIFDGGIGSDTLDKWVTEYIYDKDSKPVLDYMQHGGQVTSAYLFGPIQDEMVSKPYTPVDHFRVLDNTLTGAPDLFDVLTRITSVLDRNSYKFINLSLGPRLPIDDDDVNVWTSVLDEYLSNGNTFATIAVGNDGQARAPLNRVQPPSDMVNAMAIGSSDLTAENWKRADYSCIGPGRSPGLIKPDGLYFGGSDKEPFVVFTPISNSISGVSGTSFSSPAVLRLAAGIDSVLEHELSVPALKTLLIHKAQPNDESQAGIGWGKFPNDVSEIIECSDNEATILYQGVLRQSQYKRAFLPLPPDITSGNVIITATFCYCTTIDPEHPVNYTRSGLEVTFRKHLDKFNKGAKTPKSSTFFSLGSMYTKEQSLRDDAHKWETTLHNQCTFRSTSLQTPCFDICYQAREKGAAASTVNTPLPYALVVTISSKKDNRLYNKVLQRYQTLQPIKMKQSIRILGRS